MSTYQAAPRPQLSFGDVCDAAFLHDVHATELSCTMDEHRMAAKFAGKLGYEQEETAYFVPNPDARGDGPHPVLAHGLKRTALVLTDDCVIASALGRDGDPPSGRLLFAPLVNADDQALDSLARYANWGRFALPGDDHHPAHAIAELRRCFMVDSRAVATAIDQDATTAFVVRSLSDEMRDELALRWSAYSSRRGILVAQDSATKFARALASTGSHSREDAIALAGALASVIAAAWGYEGRALERAGDLAAELNAGRIDAAAFDAPQRLGDLRADLETLRQLCDDALGLLP